MLPCYKTRPWSIKTSKRRWHFKTLQWDTKTWVFYFVRRKCFPKLGLFSSSCIRLRTNYCITDNVASFLVSYEIESWKFRIRKSNFFRHFSLQRSHSSHGAKNFFQVRVSKVVAKKCCKSTEKLGKCKKSCFICSLSNLQHFLCTRDPKIVC